MKLRTLLVAGMATLLLSAPAFAQSVEERIKSLENRIKYLENRISNQDKAIVEKDKKLAKYIEGGNWFEAVEIGGAIEIEGTVTKPPEGDTEADLAVGTVELGVGVEVSDWVNGEVVLLWEQGEGPVDVDTATVTIGPPEGAWSITGGQL